MTDYFTFLCLHDKPVELVSVTQTLEVVQNLVLIVIPVLTVYLQLGLMPMVTVLTLAVLLLEQLTV